jgi:hypothetical protein
MAFQILHILAKNRYHLFFFKIIVILVGVPVVSHEVLICISLINDIEYFSYAYCPLMYLLWKTAYLDPLGNFFIIAF